MSVRVNDRHLSDIQYERTFAKINYYLTGRLKKIPKRYSAALTNPFCGALCEMYDLIMELTNEYNKGKKFTNSRYKLCVKALRKMEEIIQYIYTYWIVSTQKNGIKYVSYKKRVHCAEMINKEIGLINGVMQKCKGYKEGEVKIPFLHAFKNEELLRIDFIKKLVEIERIVYRKSSHMSKTFRDVQMETLLNLSREALYYAISGNEYPADAQSYKARKSHISKALDNVYKMNRPICELSFDHIFSEKELEKLCHLLTEARKLLTAIRESDEARFGHLLQ